jgi:hypothetical protein
LRSAPVATTPTIAIQTRPSAVARAAGEREAMLSATTAPATSATSSALPASGQTASTTAHALVIATNTARPVFVEVPRASATS